MACDRVNPALWNLTIGVGVAACGPLVPLPGDTDGDDGSPADDDDDPAVTTTVPPTGTTGRPGCGEGPPCPPGYGCYDGECVYEYDCDDCCDGECGYYYDCYAHDDCGLDQYCNYNDCNTAETLPSCVPGSALAFELIPAGAGDMAGLSLSFADGNGDGDPDLAVGGQDSGMFVVGPSADAAFLVADSGHAGVTAVELDGAPPSEFVFSSALGLGVWGFPGGVTQQIAFSDGGLFYPSSGDFDGDGWGDVVGIRDGSVHVGFSHGMGFNEQVAAGIATTVPVAVGNLGDAPGDDLVVAADSLIVVAQPLPGGGSQSGPLDESFGMAARTPAVGDFDGDGDDDIAALGDRQDRLLLVTWNQAAPGSFQRTPYFIVPGAAASVDGYVVRAVGDFDGDGTDDIVIGGTGTLTILFGAANSDAMFVCYAEVPIDGTANVLATGDMDGNGRADAAWSDAVSSTRIRFST